MALAFARVPAALGAPGRTLPRLLGRIGDDLGELRTDLEQLLPGAELLGAGREAPPEGEAQDWISRLFQQRFESLLQTADGARIEPHEPAEQLIGQIEAVEDKQAEELVGQGGQLVLPPLADGVLALPLREASLFGLFPVGREPIRQCLEPVKGQARHPVQSPGMVHQFRKP